MKKLLVLPLMLLTISLSAQKLKGLQVGANIGFPIGDASDVSKFSFGIDATYFFWEPIEDLRIGASTGYAHFIGKDLDYTIRSPWGGPSYSTSQKIKDFGFVPIAAAAEYKFAKQFFVAADIGVAIATQSDSDTGFYFRPKVGWDKESFQLFAFLRHVSQDTAYASSFITLGVGGAYKF